MFQRYAIYFTPEGTLAQKGAAWLGWDMTAGAHVAHPDISGIDVATLTQRPRKYGLHATIKPPFHLAKNATAAELEVAFVTLTTRLKPVTCAGLELTRLGGFLALTPRGDQGLLKTLAAEVVTTLDPFRAPASELELATRRAQNLTPAQERNLHDWGYPHVMAQFRFHITLTGRVPRPDDLIADIAPYFAPALPAPFNLDSLTLAGQDTDGMFHTVLRQRLSS